MLILLRGRHGEARQYREMYERRRKMNIMIRCYAPVVVLAADVPLLPLTLMGEATEASCYHVIDLSACARTSHCKGKR